MEIKRIDDFILDVDKELIKARKSLPLVPILVTIAGVIMIFAAGNDFKFSSAIRGIGYLTIFTGLILIVAAFIKKGNPYYTPTGEKLIRSEIPFDREQRIKVMELVADGKIEALESLKEGESSAIIAIVYKTNKGDIHVMQALEYIPHNYEPITDIHVFKK